MTKKKQKFIGIQECINQYTGETIPMQVINIEDRNFNFHKIWLQHFANSIDGISNQKLKLTFWIIDNLNKENQLIMTQRQISEKSGISIKTVSRTMQALQNGDPPFLVKINGGAYMVNPNIIWKGSHKNRMGIIYDYETNKNNIKNNVEDIENIKN